MKSSDELAPTEDPSTDIPEDPSADIPTREEVRGMLPQMSKTQYWVKRIDVPVQLGRLVLLVGMWWLWWSDTIWDGWDSLSIFGIQPLPNVPPTFRAAPGDTWDYLIEVLAEQLFWIDFWVTVKEALVGFVIASILGVTAGLLLGRFKRFSAIFGPFIILFNAMPKIAFLPLILVVYGVAEMSKVVLIIMIVFFVVQVPTQAAVALVDPDLEMVATTMGASTYQRFVKVTLPAILPAILGALRLGAIISVQGAVFAEIFSAKRGLGQRLITQSNQLNYEALFALVFVLAVVSLILNGIIGAAERHLLRWKTQSGSGGSFTQVTSL
jgi:NitT/TauT family transport system permease protein